MTGHTHQPYVCTAGNGSLIDGRPVTSASSFGRLVTNIGSRSTTRRRTSRTSRPTTRSSPYPDARPPDIQQLIDGYNTLADPIANQPVGQISADITRTTAADRVRTRSAT